MQDLEEGEENLSFLLDKLNSEFILYSSNSLIFFFLLQCLKYTTFALDS